MPPITLLGCLQLLGTQISRQEKAGRQHRLCQPPAGSRSPPAMPTPSFCHVTSGWGTPVASQDSTALLLTITITMPGRGFKAGGSASSREALPTRAPPRWAKAQGAGPPGARPVGAVRTVYHEPEVFSGCASSAPRHAGVAAGMCRQCLPDLQGSWEDIRQRGGSGRGGRDPPPCRGCTALCLYLWAGRDSPLLGCPAEPPPCSTTPWVWARQRHSR